MSQALAHGPWAYAAMGMLVMIGACLQGIGGIGFAMFAAPLAALVFPAMVPGPLLLLGGLVSLMAAWREREAIQWSLAAHAIGGRCLGAVMAAGVLLVLSARALTLAFALLLLAGVGLSLAGWRIAPTGRNAWVAGTTSGLMGTITSVGAPPLALLTQSLKPSAIRATVGSIITLGAASSVVMLAAAGRFGFVDLALGVALLPWVVVGFAISGRLARRLSLLGMRRFLLALVAGSALVLLVRSLLG